MIPRAALVALLQVQCFNCGSCLGEPQSERMVEVFKDRAIGSKGWANQPSPKEAAAYKAGQCPACLDARAALAALVSSPSGCSRCGKTGPMVGATMEVGPFCRECWEPIKARAVAVQTENNLAGGASAPSEEQELQEVVNGLRELLQSIGYEQVGLRTLVLDFQKRGELLEKANEKIRQLESAPSEAGLSAWVQHKPDCWLKFETRDLVPGGEGFGMRFRTPEDGEPSCTCGLDAALAQVDAWTRSPRSGTRTVKP